MSEIVGPGAVAASKNIYFSTTQTQREQSVEIDAVGGNFVIDSHGLIHQISPGDQNQATVTFIGGIDTFINEKEFRTPSFYLTQKQKITLYGILKILAKSSSNSELSGDDPTLDLLVTSIYGNYCG
jgi:hypothetical protein